MSTKARLLANLASGSTLNQTIVEAITANTVAARFPSLTGDVRNTTGNTSIALETTGVVAGTYGNTTAIPVITIDAKGRATSATTTTVSGVTGLSWTPSNSTITVSTSTTNFNAVISSANDSVQGLTKILDSVTNTSIDIAASVSSVKTAYDTAIAANNRAVTAYSNAVSTASADASTKADAAYSNATSYADTKASAAYSNAVSVASLDASTKAATAYSNAVSTSSSDASTKAATAYSNAVSTAATDATTKASTAYSNAVSVAATDATTKASAAYSNAISYAATIAATAYSNAVSVAASDASTKADTAYSNAVSAASSDASTKANAAYANATSYADTKANAAYSNAVSTASSDASTKAATAYSNAVAYSASNTYVNSTFAPKAGPVFTGTAAFADVTISGNLTTSGTVTYINSTNLNIGDNIVTLNADLGAVAPTENAGLEINRGSSANVALRWYEATDEWQTTVDGTTYTKIASNNDVSTAYSNAVSTAASDASTKAATAYSNATSYAATIAGTAYSNAVSTAATDATTKAATAYSNATSYAATIAGTAYSNAVAYAASNTYVNTQLGTKASLSGATFTGAVSGITTLAAGNTTIAGTIDVRSTSKIQLAGFAGIEYYNAVGGQWQGYIGTENNTGNLRYNSYNGTHTFYADSVSKFTITNGDTTSVSSSRAPIFYDSNDTTYYADLASAGSSVRIAGSVVAPGGMYGAASSFNSTNRIWAISPDYSGWGMFYNESTPSDYISFTDGTVRSKIYLNDARIDTGIFYDIDNTGFYVNPASTSYVNTLTSSGDVRAGAAVVIGTGGTTGAGSIYSDVNWGCIQWAKQSNPAIAQWRWATAGDSEMMRIDTSSNLLVYASVRSPIFYDYNDTGYYVDPNSLSKISTLWLPAGGSGDGIRFDDNGHKRITWNDGGGNFNIRAGCYFSNSALRYVKGVGDANSGAASITFDCDGTDGVIHLYTAAIGVPDAGVSYSGHAWLDRYGTFYNVGELRATKFVDYDDTGYYLDPNVLTSGYGSRIRSGTLYGPNSTWGAYLFVGGDGRQSIDASYASVCATDGNLHLDPGTSKVMYLGHYNANWIRMPGIYDNNDTGYYIDLNGTSRLNYLTTYNGGSMTASFEGGWGQYGKVIRVRSSNSDAGDGPQVWFDKSDAKSWGIGVQPYGGNQGFGFWENGSTSAWGTLQFLISPGGSTYAYTDIRSPIFYDYNDTGYYLDPNSNSNLYKVTAYQGAKYQTTDWADGFRNTPVSGRCFHGDVSAGGPQGTWWFYDSMRHSNSSSYWGTQIAYGWEDNANELWQRNITGNNFSGWVRYLNSGNYTAYAMPKGSSATNTVDIRAPIFYDSNDTTYYTDPGAFTNLYGGLQMNGAHGSTRFNLRLPAGNNGAASGDVNMYMWASEPGATWTGTGIARNRYNNDGSFPRLNTSLSAQMIRFGEDNSIIFYMMTSAGSDSTCTMTGGSFTASGNVTAYSDIRIKRDIRVIDNALERISKIRGVTYNRTDRDFDTARHAGVIAQEVELVLPEVVTENEDGIKTVAYGNMVGLLIEAIKEQQQTINLLKEKVGL